MYLIYLLHTTLTFETLPFHSAARNSSNIATRMLLDADRDCAHIRNAGGHVALHIAVQNGNLPIVTTITSMVPDCSQIQVREKL